MTTAQDPILEGAPVDRVFYTTGVLLGAEDFSDEQSYHRGRLARALAYLFGSGIVAGLRVRVEPAQEGVQEETVVVEPGLAIDRLGRIIEVPRPACLKLDLWYNQQPVDDLKQALHPRTPPVAGDPYNGVVADLFINFEVCERGKTPAFAAGPFDAIDAVQPSRLRDAYRLELVTRKDTAPIPPLPENIWPERLAAPVPAEETMTAEQKAVFETWREGTEWRDQFGQPAPLKEHLPGASTTGLFLARLVLPAAAAADPADRPLRQDGAPVEINYERDAPPLVLNPAKWVGAAPG
jgi:hypothetical protein